MLEKIIDHLLSEQNVLAAVLMFAVWRLWRKLERLIDRNLDAIEHRKRGNDDGRDN